MNSILFYYLLTVCLLDVFNLKSHSVPAASQLVLSQPQNDWRLYEYVLAAYLFAPLDKSQLWYVEPQWQLDENVCTPSRVMVMQSRQSDVSAFVPAVNLSATPLLSFSGVEVKGRPADRWCPFSRCDCIRLWYECREDECWLINMTALVKSVTTGNQQKFLLLSLVSISG